MEIKCTYINNQTALQIAAKEWNSCKELGIDLECENNLHHYGEYITLMQISSRNKNWVIDVLQLQEIIPLIQVLENPQILKVFHDVGFDLRILFQQFHCQVQNVFDTQMAALFLGKTELGLGALLHEFLNVEKEQKMQTADWTRRPLTERMLQYATKDTVYLLPLLDLLGKKLQQLGRLSWLEEELQELNKKEWTFQRNTYSDLSGYAQLAPKERGVLKNLYLLREDLAQKVDRPPYFIMSNAQLLQAAQNPPKDWRELARVHPVVKLQAELFENAVKSAQEQLLPPRAEIKRWTPIQKDHFERLNMQQERMGMELGIKKHLILSKEQIKEIVLSGKIDCLKRWQKELLVKKCGEEFYK